MADMVLMMPSTAATMPKPGSASETFCTAWAGSKVSLWWVSSSYVEQTLELVRVEVAADHQAQTIGDELEHVVVGDDARISAEEFAFRGVFDVRLDREQTLFTGFHQQVEHQLQQIDIGIAGIGGRLEQADCVVERRLDDLQGVAGDEGAQCGTDDHHDLGGVPEQQQVAARHQESDGH